MLLPRQRMLLLDGPVRRVRRFSASARVRQFERRTTVRATEGATSKPRLVWFYSLRWWLQPSCLACRRRRSWHLALGWPGARPVGRQPAYRAFILWSFDSFHSLPTSVRPSMPVSLVRDGDTLVCILGGCRMQMLQAKPMTFKYLHIES